MTPSERALLLSVRPRFAASILDGDKSVELRRQRVAVPAGMPVVLYATSPVMALLGSARVTRVETATPARVWQRHRSRTGLSREEYDVYMEGAAQASALLLERPERLSEPVPLTHLRAGSGFHPPQSYRYIAPGALRELVAGHAAAEELLSHIAPGQRTSKPVLPAAGRASSESGEGRSVRSSALVSGLR